MKAAERPPFYLGTATPLLCFFNGVEELEQAFHPGNFQCIVDPLIDADQGQPSIIFLARDVGSNQSANSGRIDQGNAREVEDEDT